MSYVKVYFRLYQLYILAFVFLAGLIYWFSFDFKTISDVFIFCFFCLASSLFFYWKRKSFYEFYEISENHIKVFYSILGIRFRIFFIEFERIIKIKSFHYRFLSESETYYLTLNLEIEETELIIKNSTDKILFKSFNLDTPNRNDLGNFDSIFDGLSSPLK